MKGFKVSKHANGANSFCGPAALSAITGKTVEEVCGILHSHVRGLRPIRGMYHSEMEKALEVMGYDAAPVRVSRPPFFDHITLAAWLRQHPRDPNDFYLVSITGHYIVVRGRKIVDNHFPEGVWLRKYPRRRTRVKRVWIIRNGAPAKSAV